MDLWRANGYEDGTVPVELRGRLLGADSLPGRRLELILAVRRYRIPGRRPLEGRLPRRTLVRLTAPPPLAGDPPWSPGDLLEVTARLGPPRNFRNPGAFDYGAYLRARRVRLVGTIKSLRLVRIVPGERRRIHGLLPEARGAIVARLRRASGHEDDTASFLAALLIGERGNLSSDLEEPLLRAGVYHIIALSGLNVGVAAFLASVLLRILPIRQGWRRCAIAVAVVIYWALARDSGSIGRASLMALLSLGGTACERRVSGLGTIAVAATLVLLANPVWVADAGFQLTFAATLGILFLAPGPAGRPRDPRAMARVWIASSWRVSAAALAGTALISARHFQTMAPAALAGNLFAVPIAALLLILAVVIVAIEPALPGVAAAGAALATLMIHWLVTLARLVSRPGFLSFYVVPPAAMLVVWGLAALIAAGASRGWPRRTATALLVVALAATAGAGRNPRATGRLEVTVLDVGQGDAILLRLPAGTTMLIDAGGFSRAGFDVGRRVVAPALRAMGLLRLDILAVTHAHLDHIGGAAAVLRDLEPRALWLGRMPAESDAGRALEDLAEALDIAVVRPRRGARVTIGGARVEVLNPAPGASPLRAAANDDSLVLRVVHRRRGVLLTGDMEAPLESALVAEGRGLGADLLKVGHHGSRTSTTAAFLEKVGAAFAVISVGATNPWRHPDAEVIERLRRAGVSLYRTDRDGALRFETDGDVPWRALRLLPRDGPRRGSDDVRAPQDHAEDEDHQPDPGDHQAPGAGRPGLVERRRMAGPDDAEDDPEDQQVPAAEDRPDRDQQERAEARHRPMGAPGDRVEHVSSIELAERQEVQSRGQQPDPGGHEGRVQPDAVPRPHPGEEDRVEEVQEEAGREADVPWTGRLPSHAGSRQTVEENREGDHETGDRPGDAHVEQRPSVGQRGAYPNDRPEGAEERGAGKEEGERGVDSVDPAGDVMPHLVRPKNQDETHGVGDPQGPVRRVESDVAGGAPVEVLQGHQGPCDERGDDGHDEADEIDQRREGRGPHPGGASRLRRVRPVVRLLRRLSHLGVG
jgi:competence protein ComEC